MRIKEIILGLARPEVPAAWRIEPHSQGLTIVPLPEDAPPAELIGRAIRETLGSSERSALTTEAPFVRITLEDGDIELTVADDAVRGERMLTEARAGEMPLLIESSRAPRRADGEGSIDAILSRVTLAAGAEGEDILLAALSQMESSPTAGDASDDELAYIEAQRRASRFSRAVHLLDERMTASVVPDWLWVATGVGGIGVFMTVIALLYPHLRVAVIGSLALFSVLGFAAYGLRSLKELRTRSLLLAERTQLRARRDEARAEVHRGAERLRDRGLVPEEVAARLIGAPAEIPAVLGGRSVPLPRDATASSPRQIIVFLEASSVTDAVDPRFVKWPSRVENIT